MLRVVWKMVLTVMVIIYCDGDGELSNGDGIKRI